MAQTNQGSFSRHVPPTLPLKADFLSQCSANSAIRRGGVSDVMFPALRRSRSHSAVDDGPRTVDVLLQLNNGELLITDDALDEIAD